MNIIITGSLGYDYIMDFPGKIADRIMPDKIHKISLSFLVNRLKKQFGGTAGNIAYSLKLLGMNPLILSAAGNDFSPYLKFLSSNKISTNYIKVIASEVTGSYFVVTDTEDNQIGAFYEGAMKQNSVLKLQSIDEKIDFVVIAPNDPSAMIKQIDECNKLNTPYMYDPAFQIDHFSPHELLEAIKNCAILIGNDYEIALIEKKLKINHEKLVYLTSIVVTTLGNKGSIIEFNPSSPPHKLRKGKAGFLKIKPAKVANTQDPTGAGDAYRAGFLAGFLRGLDLVTCGQMGSVAAAYTVEKYGTQTHKFSKEDFQNRYEENYHQKIKIS